MKNKILILILFCPLLIAGKIYKWTDDNGQVQFTQTPGPSQQLKKIYRDTTKKSVTRKTLNGNWYGTSSGIKYRLYFKDDSFQFSVINDRHTSYTIGKGYFDNDNGVLQFKYINSNNAKNKGGLIEKYIIIKFTTTQLNIRSTDNKLYNFIKLVRYNQSQSKYDNDLYGVWLNVNNGNILEFTASSFYTFDKGRYKKSKVRSNYRGNWILRNNSIELQYTGNSTYTDKIGTIEYYTIIYSNELLTITHQKTGKQRKYKKQLLGGSLLK